ncbi:hypothetical protein ACFPA8_27285 [Streptomyces ovatisporus]|uniref:Transmembrane protein n=1 Tax=Streptomyces ovatisporus TaxID=1128682 RepID=A0ABV9AGM4_9ACTN
MAMEAGPRDNEETAVDDVERVGPVGRLEDITSLDDRSEDVTGVNGGSAPGGAAEADRSVDVRGNGTAGTRGSGVADADGDADGPPRDAGDLPPVDETPVEPQDLRPPRKLRLWQIAPIVVLSALGSLMFAFPLAFEPGGGTGAVVSMLGLLICGCAAGWGVMAARRAGLTWPGLPVRGSGDRADWRVVLLYAVVVGTVVVLAIWRVARLR